MLTLKLTSQYNKKERFLCKNLTKYWNPYVSTLAAPIWLLYECCNLLPDLYSKKWSANNELSNVPRELNFDINHEINSKNMWMIFFHIYKKWHYCYLEVIWVMQASCIMPFTFEIPFTILLFEVEIFLKETHVRDWKYVLKLAIDWCHIIWRLHTPRSKGLNSHNWSSY